MYEINVLVNGYAIPVYHNFHDGTNWIEAREGNKFEIRIRNNSYNRILAVVSVDGLNAINGRHEDPDKSPGYVLPSHDNIKIPGWKIDKEKVREFYFTNKENSYSRKLGAIEENIGVIAAAIFKEKYYYTYTSYYPYGYNNPYIYPITTTPIYNPPPQWVTTCGGTSGTNICYASNNLTSGSTSSANFLSVSIPDNYSPKQLGVGSGEKKDFSTQTTYFGDKYLETILTLYYDSRDGLLRRGINLDTRSSLPKPFPNGQYCPDV
jgi:hypothetical protein